MFSGSGSSNRRSSNFSKDDGDSSHPILKKIFERVEKAFHKKDDQGALIICEAIILALYRVKQSDQFSDFEEYAEGVLEDSADWAARLWRSAGNEEWAANRRFHPDRTIPADFVQKYVPDWEGF